MVMVLCYVLLIHVIRIPLPSTEDSWLESFVKLEQGKQPAPRRPHYRASRLGPRIIIIVVILLIFIWIWNV